MGKTVPSYRMALESEIYQWKAFADSLNSQDREVFEVLMDACRNNAMAGNAACKPIIFEPMMLSILIYQQKKLLDLQEKLNIAIALV